MTTVTIKDHAFEFVDGGLEGTYGRCFGADWERVLSIFDLELPPDTFPVAATITFRDVGGNAGTIGSRRVTLFERDYTTTVEFSDRFGKFMVQRYYLIARRNGAPRIVARWMASMEVQRLIGRYMDGNTHLPHLLARFADTRLEGEVESDNADEAVRVLDGATDGGSWGWEDGELWLYPSDEGDE